MRKLFLFLLLTLWIGTFILAGPTHALELTFSQSFPGPDKPDPGGSGPWLTAFFTDSSPGVVQLDLSANIQSDDEYITEVYFNLDPMLDPTMLNITVLNPPPVHQASTISTGSDAFKADGDGYFDILFEFEQNTVKDKKTKQIIADRFDETDMVSYLISYSGLEVLSANSFAFLSANSGGEGIWLAAAHVQGLDHLNIMDPRTGLIIDSTWIGHAAPVPEPATMLLFGTGMIGLAAIGRKKLFR